MRSRTMDQRNQMLALMLEQGMISDDDYQQAIARPLGIGP